MESGHIDGIAPIWIAQHEVDDGEAIGCQIAFNRLIEHRESVRIGVRVGSIMKEIQIARDGTWNSAMLH